MLLFDIAEKRKVTREALRGKLKELGFYQLQKSVWLHAFPCEKEMALLRDFFGLEERECMCFEIKKLPEAVVREVKTFFQI